MQLCPFGTQVFNFVIGSWPITTHSVGFSCKLVGKELPTSCVYAKNMARMLRLCSSHYGIQDCSGGADVQSGNRQVEGLEYWPELSVSSCKGLQFLVSGS